MLRELQEYHKKQKAKENELFIYKTNDFDKINQRLERLYEKKEYYEYEIKNIHSDIKIKEFEFLIEEIDKQILTNNKYLQECIKNIMNE